MAFKRFITRKSRLIGTTLLASLAIPSVLRSFKPDVSVPIIKGMGDGVLSISVFRTVNATPSQ